MKIQFIKYPALILVNFFLLTVGVSAQLLKPGEIVYGRSATVAGGNCSTATVWAVGPDGANDRQLVANAVHPRISPDGRKILFKRFAANVSCNPFGGFFAWVLRDLATGAEITIGNSNQGATGFTFSPETNRGDRQIVADAAGQMCNLNTLGGATVCYGAQVPLQGFGHPWTRGGDGLIVAQNYDDFPADVGGLHTLTYDRANLQKIPNTSFIDLSPSWSNDGQTIAFARYVNPCCRTGPYFFINLFKIKPDGLDRTPLTNVTVTPGEGFSYSLVWTLDNATILNAARLNGVAGIYKIAADGSGIEGRLPLTPGAPPEWVGGIAPVYEEKEVAAWGGGVATSGSLTLISTIGQAFAGQTSTGGAFDLQSGFWTYAARRAPFDFDGDGRTDVGVFRAGGAGGNAEWWYRRSIDQQTVALPFGLSSDVPAPADFTGDGRADIAVFRPATGQWFVLRSDDLTFYAFPFGAMGDIAAPADYDGDGRADPAVFRPSSATWFVQQSSGGTLIQPFGAVADKPVVADYDGDRRADLAVFRPNGASGNAEWWYLRSSGGPPVALPFGLPADRAVPADYTGDGRADIAVFRPATGQWFVLRSEDNSFYAFPFGASGDAPAPGDYDGDGRADAAVFRPSHAVWFIQRSSQGTEITGFGAAADRPLPGVFLP